MFDLPDMRAMLDAPSTVIWANKLRRTVRSLHKLVSALKDDPDPEITADNASIALGELIMLLQPEYRDPPTAWDVVTAVEKADKLVEDAPWSRTERGWKMTSDTDYLASIDPRSLKTILDLLADVKELPPSPAWLEYFGGVQAAIPDNAVLCSQAQIGKATKMGVKGGIIKKWVDAGLFSFIKPADKKFWVVLRNSNDHETLRRIVE